MRKTIHLSGPITEEDVESEATAVEKLRSQSPHRNVIQVFRHGWMPSHGRMSPFPVYFVDMELGHLTLEQFIRARYYEQSSVAIPIEEIWRIMLDIAGGLISSINVI